MTLRLQPDIAFAEPFAIHLNRRVEPVGNTNADLRGLIFETYLIAHTVADLFLTENLDFHLEPIDAILD